MVVLRRSGRTPRKTKKLRDSGEPQIPTSLPEGEEEEEVAADEKNRSSGKGGAVESDEEEGEEGLDKILQLTELVTASDIKFAAALATQLTDPSMSSPEGSNFAKTVDLKSMTLESLKQISLSRRVKKAIAGEWLNSASDDSEGSGDEEAHEEASDSSGDGSEDDVSDEESQHESPKEPAPRMMSVLRLPFGGKMLTATEDSAIDPKTGKPINTGFNDQFTKVANGVIRLTDDAKKSSDLTANQNKGWGIQLKRNSSSTSSSSSSPNLIAKLGGALEKKVSSLSNKTNAKIRRQARPDTAGKGWFDMPAQVVTRELKQDLRMLANRNVLDPKRFYKKDNRKELPKYFQIGTVLESAADFYSARLSKKERSTSIVGEVLADTHTKGYLKRKFLEVQAGKDRKGKGYKGSKRGKSFMHRGKEAKHQQRKEFKRRKQKK